jgi:hypothetical protein
LTAINLNGATVTGNSSTQPLVTSNTGQVVSSLVIDNANPVFSSGTTASFAENATGTAYDADTTDATSVTYSLAGADAALFNINASNGVVTFIAAPNFETPADAGANNVYDVTVTATDALGQTTNQAVAITVSNVNESPTLTSGATANAAENTATSTAIYTTTGTDPDAGTTLTYALGGTDAARFDINTSTGAVSFKAAPNFEAPADSGANNVYDVTVTASDGTNTTAAQGVAITVTPVNEAPTSTPVTATNAVINVAYSSNVSGNFSDVDAGDSLTYAATGLPTGLSINASTGVITGTATATATASVTVTATDGGALTTSQSFNLAVVDAPTLQASALDDVTNFQVTSNIVLNYSENVTAAANKYIHIVNDGGTGFHGETTVHTLDILVTDTTQVTIAGGKVTLNPGFDLDLANNYHINIDAGAFVGVSSGQPTVAFDGTSSLNFSTVNPGANAVANAVQAQSMDANGALAAGYKWLDMQGIGTSISSVTLDLGSASIALVAKDYDLAGPNINDDYNGIVAGEFRIVANNFGANDLIYFDDQGNNLANANDLNLTNIGNAGSAPTILRFNGSSISGATTPNGFPGRIDITLAGSTAGFESIAAIDAALVSTSVISA